MLFDTHAHLDDRAFDVDREALLSDLPGQGLALVMNPGCSLASSRNVDKLTREYDYIYGAVGSHPDHFDPRQYLKPARANIKEMVRHKLINVLGCAGKA